MFSIETYYYYAGKFTEGDKIKIDADTYGISTLGTSTYKFTFQKVA